MSKQNLTKLNKELKNMGIEPIKEVDTTPERTAYYKHLEIKNEERQKNWNIVLKILKEQYIANFHKIIKEKYNHLYFEKDEDKVYWLYNKNTGIYDEYAFPLVRSLIIKELLNEGFDLNATEATSKNILNKYRSMCPQNGLNYDDFDNDNDWFHAGNGWVQVHTLEFVKHTPDKLSRRVSAVIYKKDARCPVYDEFLDSQIQLPADQTRAIDQFSGLLLTPDITKQKMLVLIGKPGSGKSTLLDCWSDILGDCSIQMALSETSGDSFRFGGSSLVGKHLCWFDEVEVTRSNMGNTLINLITGQHIRVERKGVHGIVEAQNKLKCVLTANTLPRSAEMGIYRRMILIYFEYSFYDNDTDDKDIRNIFKSESSGILNRMIKGLADLSKNNGFTKIDGQEEILEEYKVSSNTMAEFLEEYFEFSDDDSAKVKTKILLETYKNFSKDRYSESLTPQKFGLMVKNNGLNKFNNIESKKDRDGNKEWSGLKLKSIYEVDKITGMIRGTEEDW